MIKNMLIKLLILSSSISSFANEKIHISGSSTVAPLINELAKKYESTHKNIRIDVQTGGSTRGINDTRQNVVQLGMVSRSLTATESDLKSHLIATDGLGIITHKNNRINNLTSEQVKNIYLGKIKNWKELGGSDTKIILIHKAEGRSTLELFLHHLKIKNSDIKADIIIGDNEQGIKSVMQNENAIGYVSIGSAEYNISVGTKIKLLQLDGISASTENVAKKVYPLMRELILVSKPQIGSSEDNFIKFVQSKEAQATIKEHYFVTAF